MVIRGPVDTYGGGDPKYVDRGYDDRGYDDAYLDPLDPDAVEGPSIGRWIVAAVAVLALIAGGYFAFNAVQSKAYNVPPLSGQTEGAAMNMITEYGWNVLPIMESSLDIPAGSVIRTDPPEGSSLRSGGDMTFYISSGPPPVPLPDIVGLKVDRAKELLLEKGLEVGDEVLEYDDNIPEGNVIRFEVREQPTLAVGEEVVPGTIINLVVSQGATPIDVPNLVCLSVTEAETKLREAGLKMNRADTAFSEAPQGSIAEQAPAFGEQLSPGRAVTVKISRGPELVAFPSLVGKTFAEAEQLLKDVGLVVGAVEGDKAKKVLSASRLPTVSSICAAAATTTDSTAAPTTTAAPAPVALKSGNQVAKGTKVDLKFG